MTTTPSPSTAAPSTLRSLRSLTPARPLSFTEALRIAERQATKLIWLLDAADGIHEHHLTALPRITVDYAQLPVSGMSHWNGHAWVISLNKSDALVRQRFTLLHEFKHIIDHGQTSQLYTGDHQHTPAEQAEHAADYFAGCALVSRPALKRAWGNLIQHPTDLATHFGVSEHAILVRLAQTGLSRATDREDRRRCARPISTRYGEPQRFRTAKTAHAGRRVWA